jgi:pimeloyl-ACP methyl ester carboxylesterase
VTTPTSESASKRKSRRRIVYGALLIYALLLIASHVVTSMRYEPPQPEASVQVPAMRASGPITGREYALAYTRTPANPDAPALTSGNPPVLLLHGTPGDRGNFLPGEHIIPGGPDRTVSVSTILADAGYASYAIDLPGFGESEHAPPDYSIRAHARAVLALMDELGIERAHVLGFSMGGGVALNMADLDPERLATITLLSSIGDQRAEGSGDYFFEHGKYAVGYTTIVLGLEAVPHFGALGPHWMRNSFIRNFWDTDQRPLHLVMQNLRIPTLIIHGRRDFLVPAWGAEYHHELIRPSRLVMLDASHFIPFIEPQVHQLGAHVIPFLDRHNRPGVPALRYSADFAPAPKDATSLNDILPGRIDHFTPWWLLILLIVLGTLISEDATVITVGILIARGQLDFAIGLIGCFTGIVIGDGGLWAIGRFAGRRALKWPFLRTLVPEKSLARWGRWFDRHAVRAVFVARAVPGLRLPTYLAAGLLSDYSARFILWAMLAALLWTPFLLILAGTLGHTFLTVFEGVLSGPLAIVIAVVVILMVIRFVEYLATAQGRRRLQRDVQIAIKPEFWPAWLLYVPAVPYLAWLALRHRGPFVFTHANPGIPNGGGVVGESKRQILESFTCDPRWVLHARCIEAGPTPEERTELARSLIESDAGLGGYPVVLKPDEAQRGHAVKLARSEADLLPFFESMTRDAIMQRFHPGPHEIGLLWARKPDRNGDTAGEIFSITKKEFPRITGDGEHTLEELIWRHPRYRIQADIFLKRHTDRVDMVLADGEEFALGVAGNHCQGTTFYDGADMITPELTARIDEISRSFQGATTMDGAPGALDFGRYDIRYASEDALRAGEDFAIVELNGVMSESTNMYDPAKPAWWLYRVLFAQWRRLFALGAWRRKQGFPGLNFRMLVRIVRSHYRGRGGSSVSD